MRGEEEDSESVSEATEKEDVATEKEDAFPQSYSDSN